MWVEQKTNGKYLFREKYMDYLTEKEKTVSVTLDKSTREIYLHIINKMKSDTKDLLELL